MRRIIFGACLLFVFCQISTVLGEPPQQPPTHGSDANVIPLGGNPQEDGQKITQALANGQGASGQVQDGTPYQQNGQNAKAGGQVEIQSGQMTRAQRLETPDGTKVAEAKKPTLKPGGLDADKVQRLEKPPSDSNEKRTVLVEAVNVRKRGKTTEAESAKRVEHGGIKADKVRGIRIQDSQVTFAEAERVEIPEGILTQVREFVGQEIQFQIGHARDVVLGCITMRQVRDSDFTISESNIEIAPAAGISFHIADCGFSQNNFEAHSDDASLVISKARRAQYEIREGELQCHSVHATEKLQANTTANVQFGSSCFSCIEMEPASTYWYNDQNLARDFGVHVPASGERFRLCLKKEPLDYFAFFDGLIDFVERQITLTKIVTFLKYPFRDDQVASLIMDTLVEDRSDFRARMQLDENFILVKELTVDSVEDSLTATESDIKIRTVPSNFYELREQAVGNETHRLARIDFRLPKGQITQARLASYGTNYLEPKLTFGVDEAEQFQRSGSVLLLTPEHREIETILG